jgi:hypothetical protein
MANAWFVASRVACCNTVASALESKLSTTGVSNVSTTKGIPSLQGSKFGVVRVVVRVVVAVVVFGVVSVDVAVVVAVVETVVGGNPETKSLNDPVP